MVSDHFDIFSDLGYDSMLFEGAFYERCILNSLTLRDIKNSEGIWNQKSQLHLLEEGIYTFAELKTLRYAKPVYIQLYNKLQIERVDERLVVIRQMLKKNLLSNIMAEEDMDVLAARLSEAPLSVWREMLQALVEFMEDVSVYDMIIKLLPQSKETGMKYFACDYEIITPDQQTADVIADFLEALGQFTGSM